MNKDEFTIYSYSNSDILRNIPVPELLSPSFSGTNKRGKVSVWSNKLYTIKKRILFSFLIQIIW